MVSGVDFFSGGRGAEEFCELFKSFYVGLSGIGGLFLIGLGFAGEGGH